MSTPPPFILGSTVHYVCLCPSLLLPIYSHSILRECALDFGLILERSLAPRIAGGQRWTERERPRADGQHGRPVCRPTRGHQPCPDGGRTGSVWVAAAAAEAVSGGGLEAGYDEDEEEGPGQEGGGDGRTDPRVCESVSSPRGVECDRPRSFISWGEKRKEKEFWGLEIFVTWGQCCVHI